MNTLELVKNYIDAKFEYERAGLGRSSGMFSASTSLTEGAQRIMDRYIEAETQLNLAIEAERKANP